MKGAEIIIKCMILGPKFKNSYLSFVWVYFQSEDIGRKLKNCSNFWCLFHKNPLRTDRERAIYRRHLLDRFLMCELEGKSWV